MLFMGQEFAASNPFHYFADHEPELAELVHTGRQRVHVAVSADRIVGESTSLGHPAEEHTFLECKLKWDECESELAAWSSCIAT